MPELSQKLGAKPGAEVLVFFTTRRAELERRFAGLKKTLTQADGLWIAWPKKASKLDTDLDFAAVQQMRARQRARRQQVGGDRRVIVLRGQARAVGRKGCARRDSGLSPA